MNAATAGPGMRPRARQWMGHAAKALFLFLASNVLSCKADREAAPPDLSSSWPEQTAERSEQSCDTAQSAGPPLYRLVTKVPVGEDQRRLRFPHNIVVGNNGSCLCITSYQADSETPYLVCYRHEDGTLSPIDASALNKALEEANTAGTRGLALSSGGRDLFLSVEGTTDESPARLVVAEYLDASQSIHLLNQYESLSYEGKPTQLSSALTMLSLSGDDAFLYAVGWFDGSSQAEIVVLSVDDTLDSPAVIQRVATAPGITPPPLMAMSANGKYIYTFNWELDRYVIFTRNKESGLMQLLLEQKALAQGLATPAYGLGFTMAAGPDDRYLLVGSDWGASGVVAMLEIGLEEGAEGANEGPVISEAGVLPASATLPAGASGVASLPGTGQYMASLQHMEKPPALASIQFDASEGILVAEPAVADAGGQDWECTFCDGLDKGRHIAFSPDGRYVYVACYDLCESPEEQRGILVVLEPMPCGQEPSPREE